MPSIIFQGKRLFTSLSFSRNDLSVFDFSYSGTARRI